MTRSRRFVRVAALALLPAVVVACSRDGRHTALIGDSLMAQAAPVAKALMKGSGSVQVIAFPGVRMDQFQDEVERAVAKDPDAMVILLGANNIGQGGWTAGDAEQLQRMLATLGTARCVRWINASTATDRADYNASAQMFNRALATEVGRFPPIEVVDWARRQAATPGWIIPGDIHLTVAGRDAMGRMIAAAAKDCLQRG
jgi:hypothetical protein